MKPSSLHTVIFLAIASIAACAASGAGVPVMPASSTIAAKFDFAKARTLPATSAAMEYVMANVTTLRHQAAMLEKSFGIPVAEKLGVAYAFSDGFSFNGSRISLRDATVSASGDFDSSKISAALSSAQGYKRAKAGEREVATADFAQGFWFWFPEKDSILVASSASAIAKAIAAIDGRAARASGKSVVARVFADDAPAAIAIDGSSGAQNLSLFFNGMLGADASSILARITENTPGTARMDIEMGFPDAKTANQAFASINGLKLLAAFQQANKSNASSFVQRLIDSDLKIDGSTVRASVAMTAEDVASLSK